jgi:hypothetical protein
MFRKLMSLFRKVDQVQSEADSLNDLIYRRPSQGPYHYSERIYGLTPRQCERLGVVFLKYQDEVLSPWAIRRLENRLKNRRSVLAYYIDFQHLTVMLRLYYSGLPELDLPLSAGPVLK